MLTQLELAQDGQITAAIRKVAELENLEAEFLFDLIEKQLADGIAFMAIHCGINRYTIERLRKQGYRYAGLVSKGGTFMVSWMASNQKENPLYEQFDRVFKKISHQVDRRPHGKAANHHSSHQIPQPGLAGKGA
jgi:thiamine biosynthesis protein ThiC